LVTASAAEGGQPRLAAVRLRSLHQRAARASAARGGRHEEVIEHVGAVREHRAERRVELRESDDLASLVLGDKDHRFLALEALVEITPGEGEVPRLLVELPVCIEEWRYRVEVAVLSQAGFRFVAAMVVSSSPGYEPPGSILSSSSKPARSL
jgi:hypothetical protein